jgi:hypothetical protein
MRFELRHKRAAADVVPCVPRDRMRRLTQSCCFACLLMLGLNSGCARAIWYVAPEFGEKKAQKDNLPILYYFKAWDSTQHRNMLKNVLHDPRVDKELKKTINIELEYGFFDEQSERYKVRKPQVCVLAAPDGTRLTPNYSVNPVPTADAFLAWLKDAIQLAPPSGSPTTDPPNPAVKPNPETPPPSNKPIQKME